VSFVLDSTNRTEVLRIIDRGMVIIIWLEVNKLLVHSCIRIIAHYYGNYTVGVLTYCYLLSYMLLKSSPGFRLK